MITKKITNIQEIQISEIWVDEASNCRGKIIPMDIMELAKSIEQKGLLQNVVVRTAEDGETFPDNCKYKLVAGFRRITALKFLKRTEVSANVREDMTEQDASIVNLVENIAREDIGIMKEAVALERIFKDTDATLKEIGKMVGKSATWVETRQMFLMADEVVQQAYVDGKIGQAQLKQIIRQPVDKQRMTIMQVKEAIEKGMNSKEVVDTKPKPCSDECKQRTQKQMTDMREHLISQLGTNPASRVLSWAQGFISDDDFFADFADEPNFERPDWRLETGTFKPKGWFGKWRDKPK